MPVEWTPKQDRKYEHIVESERDSGESTPRAKEIAARTVNKERAQRGQSKTASHSASGRGRTKEQLYNEARQRNIPGRSSMSKDELRRAVDAR